MDLNCMSLLIFNNFQEFKVCYQGWNRSPAQVGCMRQVLRAGALGTPRGMGWRGRQEGGSGWGTHVNPWLIHVNVWQKPLQYCKVISLQLIKTKEKFFKKSKKQNKTKPYSIAVWGWWKLLCRKLGMSELWPSRKGCKLIVACIYLISVWDNPVSLSEILQENSQICYKNNNRDFYNSCTCSLSTQWIQTNHRGFK